MRARHRVKLNVKTVNYCTFNDSALCLNSSMDEYTTIQLEAMLLKVNADINRELMQINSSEDFKRIGKMREQRILLEREISIRGFTDILSA